MTSDSFDDHALRALYEHVLTADAQFKTVQKTCASYLRSEFRSNDALLSIQRTTFIISLQNKVDQPKMI